MKHNYEMNNCEFFIPCKKWNITNVIASKDVLLFFPHPLLSPKGNNFPEYGICLS